MASQLIGLSPLDEQTAGQLCRGGKRRLDAPALGILNNCLPAFFSRQPGYKNEDVGLLKQSSLILATLLST